MSLQVVKLSQETVRMSSDTLNENPVRRNRERLAKFYGNDAQQPAVEAEPPQRQER